MAGFTGSIENFALWLCCHCKNACYTPASCDNIGASPSGKAAAFDAAIRRFESCRPSQQRKRIRVLRHAGASQILPPHVGNGSSLNALFMLDGQIADIASGN
jgi:hypothetical protein